MHASAPPPPPSWKSVLFFALLFALALAFAQGGILFLASLTQTSLTIGLWFFGTSTCFLLGGGLCAFKTTRGLDAFTTAKWSRLSGLLMGIFSSLLWFLGFALYLVWYINWWIPTLSTQGNGGHVMPGSGMSPQKTAQFGLLFLPFEIAIFLLGNLCFVLLALMGGTLAGRLRANHIARRQK